MDRKLLCGEEMIKFVIVYERKKKITTCIWLSREKRASDSIFYQDEWLVLAAKKRLTTKHSCTLVSGVPTHVVVATRGPRALWTMSLYGM